MGVACGRGRPVGQQPGVSGATSSPLLVSLLAALSILVSCSGVSPASSAVRADVASGAQPAPRPIPPQDPRAYYHFLLGYLAELKQDTATAAKEYQVALSRDPTSLFLKVRIAALYFSRGQIREAVRYADLITASNAPIDDAETLELLAGIYAGAGQADKALSLYGQAIHADQTRSDAYFSKGVLLVNLKRIQEAEEAFKQGLAQNPESPIGYYYLGRIGVETNRPEQAIVRFTEAINIEPSFEPAYTALASVFEAQEQGEKAAEVYRQYLDKVNPRSMEVRHHLVRLYISQKSYERALAEVDAILKEDPQNLDARLRAGLIYGELKQYSKAIEELRAILAVRPTELRVRDYLGLIYEELKEYDHAIAAYEENLKLQPAYVDGRLHLGFLLYRLKRYPEAIGHLTEAVNLNPKKPEAAILLGLTYLQSDRYREASEAFEEGIRHNPDNADLHFNLGTAYDKLDRFEDLVQAMEAALRLNPDHADALNYLGYSYAERGVKIQEALTLIQRALSLKPDNGYYVDSLGWALFKLGKHEEALAEIKCAASLVGDDPVIFEHLGEIYLVMNRMEEAKEAWVRALELDPSNRDLIKRFRALGFDDPSVTERLQEAQRRNADVRNLLP
ncbi:MAG: tetratricopeptide repeat protein [Nitrospirales bacterium]